MNCEELMAALNEYVDGNVDLAICEEFKKHLEGCNPCQIVVDNIRLITEKDGEPARCLASREPANASNSGGV